MKNTRFERFGRLQRQFHRNHPWSLSQGGLEIPYSFAERAPDSLSYDEDVGFILNTRRVIVCWRHPRCVYRSAIAAQSWAEAGEGPDDDWMTEGGTTHYRKVGASRKKIVGYTSRQPSEEQVLYYALLDDIQKRLTTDGIDLDVPASWKRKRLPWVTSITLTAPLEVRNEADLAVVAQLARRLILGQTTLNDEFPGYRYSRADWLREHSAAND